MNKVESKRKIKEAVNTRYTKTQKSARGRKALKDEQKKNKSITLYLSNSDYES